MSHPDLIPPLSELDRLSPRGQAALAARCALRVGPMVTEDDYEKAASVCRAVGAAFALALGMSPTNPDHSRGHADMVAARAVLASAKRAAESAVSAAFFAETLHVNDCRRAAENACSAVMRACEEQEWPEKSKLAALGLMCQEIWADFHHLLAVSPVSRRLLFFGKPRELGPIVDIRKMKPVWSLEASPACIPRAPNHPFKRCWSAWGKNLEEAC